MNVNFSFGDLSDFEVTLVLRIFTLTLPVHQVFQEHNEMQQVPQCCIKCQTRWQFLLHNKSNNFFVNATKEVLL